MNHIESEKMWKEYTEFKQEHGVKSPAAMTLRNLIVEANIGFAQYCAHRVRYRVPDHQDIDDLVSYAYIGLIDAVEKFNPDMGCKFPSYAIRRISGAILDGLRAEDVLPRTARQKVKRLEQETLRQFEELQRDPTTVELAKSMDMTIEELAETVMDAQTAFLPIDTEHHDFNHDTRHEDPELNMEVHNLSVLLAKKLSALGLKERIFCAARYDKHLNLAEIGAIVGVNESRIGQLRYQVIAHLTEKD